MDEIINVIVERDIEKDKQEGMEKTITVEYSYMDFQWMIIGEKMRNYGDLEDRIQEIKDKEENKDKTEEELDELIHLEKSKKFVFDNHYLSQMMIQPSIEFYLQDAIQKIIDYQFEMTFRFFSRLALIYTLGYVTPLLIIIFVNDVELNKYCYVIGYFTQLFFFGVEIIQMRDQGWNYF